MNQSHEIVLRYFPELTPEQVLRFSKLMGLYEGWNSKINLISRKDIGHLYVNHVLHALGIAKVISFRPGTRILDVGTGGGFPGIPLAIMFPASQFHLIDSIGKKIMVVNDVVKALNLTNVTTEKGRAEELKDKFDFVISRAVTGLPEFFQWTYKLINANGNNSLPNGILYLKGGDLTEELKALNRPVEIFDLKKYFEEDYFQTKKIVYINPDDAQSAWQ
jgi:16S rRNA (guanine527-N7)-methyltransferase